MSEKRSRDAAFPHSSPQTGETLGQPPDEVVLGFRAFDIHELLLHFIADRLGFYRDAGLKVRLRDLTFVSDYREHALSVACGSVLVARAKGVAQKVVFVGCDYPMFWLYGDITKGRKSAGEKLRIATFPPLSAPWYMLPMVLREHGIDAKQTDTVSVRDDVGRIGLLRSENVDAAVISSTFPPAEMKRFDLNPTLFFGDHLRMPTTGLTASEEMIRTQPGVVRAMVKALKQSLRAVQSSPSEAVKVVEDILGTDVPVVQHTYSLIARWFVGDGTGDAESRRKALAFANDELAPTQPLKEADVYDFSLLSSASQ